MTTTSSTATHPDRSATAEPVIVNRAGRRGLHRLLGDGDEHPLVHAISDHLSLDPQRRYDIGLIRISAKGNLDKLDDQKDTGVEVYAHLPDFAALAASSIKELVGTWLAVSYQHLNPRATQTGVFGWVGLVGDTIFVAVADSAIEANLPPDQCDVARTGQNAYTQLVMAASLAGCAQNIYAPFRSRWWRADQWGVQLLDFIARRLPGCTLWDSNVRVAVSGAERVSTVMTSQVNGSVAATSQAEAFLEKSITHLKAGGQWERRAAELPLGLTRKLITRSDGTTGKALSVIETKHRKTVEAALTLLAKGGTWEEVGLLFARRKVPMNGTLANGRTFADYRSPWFRTDAARNRILKHLEWYRTGEWVVRRYTKLAQDQVRGIPLKFDEVQQRRYYDVPLVLPWRPFLTDDEWAAAGRRITELAAEKETRRRTGGAAHRHSRRGAAFKGVPTWCAADASENLLAAETPTAYRWRRNGKIAATLRRPLVHRGCGTALLAGLAAVEEPLAPVRTFVGDDPVALAASRVAALDARIADARDTGEIADEELLAARKAGRPDAEAEHWREKGSAARARVAELEVERAAAAADLERVHTQVKSQAQTAEADVTEAVLLASLLADGDSKVDPVVTALCERYGITTSLQARWDTRPRPGRNGTVQLTATAAIPLADGGVHLLQLTWSVDNTHNAPGDAALGDSIVRAWAAGASFEDIAGRYPGYTATRVRKQVSDRLKRLGISRDLRRCLLNAPVSAPKAIIAAKVLRDPSLAKSYRPALRADIEHAYVAGGVVHTDIWCDSPHLDDYRRVLDVFATGENAVLDIATVARKAGVPRARIYKMLQAHLLDKVGAHGVIPRRCPWTARPGAKACGRPLTTYCPAPETASGLICGGCGRPEGKDGVLPEEYLRRWVRNDGVYTVADRANDIGRARAGERMLTVAEVATLLGISASAVRTLDREDQLVPDGRDGSNSGRRYSERRISSIPEAKRQAWRDRFAGPAGDGLLSTADVAALLDCDPGLVRDLAAVGVLPVAGTTAGGHRRFCRSDVDALDRAGIDAYKLAAIGEAAAQFGLPTNTLRDLADPADPSSEPKVRSYRTILGQRRFDLDELGVDLRALNLDGTQDNPLVSIGELATHPQIRLSTGQVRALTDRGVIPAAGRVGGKRRYRLADALRAVFDARAAGQAPAPGGQLPPGRR